MLIVPWLVIRMPPDYFIRPRASASYTQWRYPIFRWIVKVAKNIFGVILLILGIAMLVLPGQGLLTMAAGILLMDFPGKRRFERWLVRRPAILRSANWMRRRAGRIPLQVR
ncbi:hypothetical protein CGZ80_01665 [Rhodopirellula sp. MGV]|nr:hypothetical protein CGZ80_01665 [Rhodopirellula sp. MGV]PNY33521.1 hypothetical protein C2E31_28165 [Rhodopirellula baltica]